MFESGTQGTENRFGLDLGEWEVGKAGFPPCRDDILVLTLGHSIPSDLLHRAAREVHAPAKTLERQYREHDELRYSLRSAQSATRGWKETRFHLVANSYAMPPFPSDDGKDGEEEQEEFRLGQVPQWFDLMKASEESPKVTVHYGQFSFPLVPPFTETRILSPDANIFRLLPPSPNGVTSESEIAAWRESSLPTFNR